MSANAAGLSLRELSDFDWSLKMALSSDKLAGLRKPLLQLQLQTADPCGRTEDTLLELDSEEVAKLLKTLIAAQKIAHIA